jgi:hypothetical protein
MTNRAAKLPLLFVFVIWTLRGQSDDAFLAIKVLAPKGEAVDVPRAEEALQRELHATIIQIAAARQAGIVVFRPPETTPAANFAQSLKAFADRHSRDFQMLTVEKSQSALRIPTGNVILQFKDDIGADEARAFLAEAGLRLVQQPTALRPTRFVVEPEGSAKQDPLALAKALAANPLILFAEADLLIVSPPPANANGK